MVKTRGVPAGTLHTAAHRRSAAEDNTHFPLPHKWCSIALQYKREGFCDAFASYFTARRRTLESIDSSGAARQGSLVARSASSKGGSVAMAGAAQSGGGGSRGPAVRSE